MDIQLTDYKGHTWHLAGHREGDEGVTLHKISGTTGKLSDHPVPTTQHFPTHTLSLIHISEPTRRLSRSRMPSSA